MDTTFRESTTLLINHYDKDDSSLVNLLVDAGLSYQLAERIVVFAPIAFGRVIIYTIDNVSLSESFIWETKNTEILLRYALFDEFKILSDLAYEVRQKKMLSKDSFFKIANKSVELKAVNNALKKLDESGQKSSLEMLNGSNFTSNRFWGFDELLSDEELDEIINIQKSCLNQLKSILNSHDIKSQIIFPWLHSNNKKIAFKLDWLPSSSFIGGQLDVYLKVGENQEVKESFAGQGDDTESAIINAFENFKINSFHVMIETFFDYHDPDQVLIEDWEINNNHYKAYIGNIGTKAAHGEHPGLPEGLFNTIESTIKAESLTEDLYAFRFYYGNINNDDSSQEALMNNKDWHNGFQAMNQIKWLPCPHFYSARLFIILKKVPIKKASLLNKIKSLFN